MSKKMTAEEVANQPRKDPSLNQMGSDSFYDSDLRKDFEELLVSLGHESQVMTDTRETVNKLWQMHCKLDDDVQCMKEGSGVDAIRELRAEMIGVTRKQRRALEEAVRSLNESKADRRELFLVQKKMASNAGEPSITLKSVHSEHTAHINWMSTVPPGSENAPRVLKRGMMRPQSASSLPSTRLLNYAQMGHDVEAPINFVKDPSAAGESRSSPGPNANPDLEVC
mmetsp:Transcript_24810/g.66975  ORF Transcript_24810/g.66975 Transcript_24810/m.66975 type:complete len:225 (+) Transcript_24810:650-1324(+)